MEKQQTYKPKSTKDAEAMGTLSFGKQNTAFFEEHHKTLDANSFYQGTESYFQEKKDRSHLQIINESKDNIMSLNTKHHMSKFTQYIPSKEEKRSTNSQNKNTSNQRQCKFSSQASQSISNDLHEDGRIALVEQTLENIQEEAKETANQVLISQNQVQTQENEANKLIITVDQLKDYQGIRNPMTKYQLIFISLAYISSVIAAFPLSLKGIITKSCDIHTNFQYHLIYFVFVFLVIITTDIYSMIVNGRIIDKINSQNQHYYKQKSFSFCGCICDQFVVFLNLLCSACFIFELYSDLIIIWIGVFSQQYAIFGFFAVIFPLVNRITQIYCVIKLFIFALKQMRKTIANERIDQLVLILNMYNIS
ncbi:UNKNOWN [Stylonychia lemnae]|uniref:Transmembrane protein n=1 Tax=Stylonychia lemnae TaxID=5949 RepID=A0A078A7Y1_STYLE|nr:UNKNOWN [Stylonychia lemnae]|eukprot:CDW77687.1 UNKNOWN [Stylonychia lemnae]